jgi:hypothetical protein
LGVTSFALTFPIMECADAENSSILHCNGLSGVETVFELS